MTSTLIGNLLAVALMHTLVWSASLWRRDVSIVDLFWGVGFILIGWRTLSAADASPLSYLLVAMVTLWGLRLSGYLTWRNWAKSEDSRYARMRERGGKWFPLTSLAIVFWLQALLTWIVALPLQTGILTSGEIGPLAVAGAVVWLVGLAFETIGDYQLARFKADPANRGKVMNRGLWHYTRHPNYFGDFLVWWGIYFASTQAGFVWWAVIGPLVMSVLLLRVSGVTLLESSLKSRLDGYDEYVRRTNAFFPWAPQKR
jgi:steroid 5-alpha reductase family enzyme